jgi:hypothetical protein
MEIKVNSGGHSVLGISYDMFSRSVEMIDQSDRLEA